MQIFITGANGFIGGAVASALIVDGHTVRGLVRSKAKADAVQRTASKQPLDRLMTRLCCKPKLGLPMLSSLRPAAIIAVRSRR